MLLIEDSTIHKQGQRIENFGNSTICNIVLPVEDVDSSPIPK